VVGGRLAIGAALAQQGVRTYPVGRGKRATMAATLAAWSDDERAVVQRMMEDIYTRFVERVAAGRKKTLDEVRRFAQGRVWTGEKAKELGLVDELGGLDAAMAEAARLGGVAVTTEPELYPPTPTLRDFFASFGAADARSDVRVRWLGGAAEAELAALAALEPRLAEAARQLLGQLAAFRSSSIQAVAWLPVVR
jgi:protease-4